MKISSKNKKTLAVVVAVILAGILLLGSLAPFFMALN